MCGMLAGSFLKGKKKCNCSSVKHCIHDKEEVRLSWAKPATDAFIFDFADILPSQEEDLQACSHFFCVSDVTGGGETRRLAWQLMQALLFLATNLWISIE